MTENVSAASFPRYVIRGAGIIGLSIAWALIRRGLSPVIYDPSGLNNRASWAAAGMLSSRFEWLVEPDAPHALRALAEYSGALWPDFASDLQRESGIDLHYIGGPTLALLPEETFALWSRSGHQPGLPAEADEAMLAAFVPGLVAGAFRKVLLAQDGQVDNRAVLRALIRVCQPFMTDAEPDILPEDVLIECLGWRSEKMRPVKGQMLSLRPDPSHPRIPVRWGSAYIVPKHDRTIIGASVEPDETSSATDIDTLAALQDTAASLFPALGRSAEILERWSGLRPMAPCGRPVIGWIEPGRHYIATGHYRNGILLAPATADLAVDDLLSGCEVSGSRLDGLRP